jgi:adenosylcobinamide-GDP ribazoletransferase
MMVRIRKLKSGQAMKSIVLAFQFLTILPLPHLKVTEADFGRSVSFFPLAGWFLGTVLYLLQAFLVPKFSALATGFLLTMALAVLTRGFHLEGFGDFLDGFLGSKDKTGILAIMKDSHAGTYAVIGLILLVAGKVVFVGEIAGSGSSFPLILVPVFSRWGMTLLLVRNRYAGTAGLATIFVDNVKVSHIIFSSAFLLPAFLAAPLSAFLAFVVTVIIVILIRTLSSRRIGGITGDVAGAANELTEFFLFFTFVC